MWSNLSSSIKIFLLCLKSQRKATGVLHGALNRGSTTWISVQSIKRFSALRGQSMACSNISPLQFCLSALVALVIVSPNYSASYWSAGFPWSILVLCILTTILEVSSVINDPLRMPNVINKYFSSVGNNLATKLPQAEHPYMDYLCNSKPPDTSFFFKPVIPLEVKLEILSIANNKSSGLYSCSAQLLKRSCDIISPVLANFLNKSVSLGPTPLNWKCPKLYPSTKLMMKQMPAIIDRFHYCQTSTGF